MVNGQSRWMWGIVSKFFLKWFQVTKFWKACFATWFFSFKWRISFFQFQYQHKMLLPFYFSFFLVTIITSFPPRVVQSSSKVLFIFLHGFLTNSFVVTWPSDSSYHILLPKRHQKFSFATWQFWEMLHKPVTSLTMDLRCFENLNCSH